ncbi:MAG: patatin-like phospholipase family protein [Salinivirgaceae bacterium]|nr:patatin-like phospholipase family protein [Salinivirgaceae bacterium]
MSNYPFKNLVFRGGGILGIAYLGALRVLDSEEYDILKQIKRVSGASAGAITALVTSISSSADEIKQLANSLDFSKVPDKRADDVSLEYKIIAKFFGAEIDDVACIRRLIKEYGWYTSEFFYDWLKTTIDGQFKKAKNISDTIIAKRGMQTFSDFRQAGFRDIYISVTNVSKHKNEIFSFETKPDMPVADAVRMSMSIPLYFNSIPYGGDHYADGGTVNNYPMEIFDDAKYADDAKNYVDGINWETFGCHLYTPEGARPEAGKKDNLIHYIENLFMTLLKVQIIEYNKTPNLKDRSADINDLGISAIDFDIKADNEDPLTQPVPGTKYDQLYRSGYDGMTAFLKNNKR